MHCGLFIINLQKKIYENTLKTLKKHIVIMIGLKHMIYNLVNLHMLIAFFLNVSFFEFVIFIISLKVPN